MCRGGELTKVEKEPGGSGFALLCRVVLWTESQIHTEVLVPMEMALGPLGGS